MSRRVEEGRGSRRRGEEGRGEREWEGVRWWEEEEVGVVEVMEDDLMESIKGALLTMPKRRRDFSDGRGWTLELRERGGRKVDLSSHGLGPLSFASNHHNLPSFLFSSFLLSRSSSPIPPLLVWTSKPGSQPSNLVLLSLLPTRPRLLLARHLPPSKRSPGRR